MRTHQYAHKKRASSSHILVPRPSEVQSSVEPQPIQAKSKEEGLAEHAERLRKFQRLGNSMIRMGPPRLDNNMASSVQPQPWIQRKLTIGQPGDKYEQEADRVASQVVQTINASTSKENNIRQSIQREKDLEGLMYAKGFQAAIQRKQVIEGGEATPNLESAIHSARGSGQPLDAGLQQSMGQAMGADFSEVRVHTDAQSDQLNQSIQARAFTTGQDVFFRGGAYQPGNLGGQELIAHELTHVMQQNGDTAQQVFQKQRLQKHSNSSGASKLMIQRAVKTNGGIFETTRYEPYYEENVGKDDETALGADIKLTFLPNQLVKDTKPKSIGLIQTVRSMKSTEKGTKESSTPEDSPNKKGFKLDASEGEEGWGIDKRDLSDQGYVNTNPLYAAENKRNESPERLSETNPSMGLGTHWYSFFKEDKPAELYDKPRCVLEYPQQEREMKFEVAALIIDGELEGTYLGSVEWGWEKKKGQKTILQPPAIKRVSKGVPSRNFRKASYKWNTWNEGKREGEDVVEVPINKAVLAPRNLKKVSTADLIAEGADSLTIKEFYFPKHDEVEIRVAKYQLKQLKAELFTRRDFSEDLVRENINERIHSSDTIELLVEWVKDAQFSRDLDDL